MDYQGVIASIDAELARLHEVRKLLAKGGDIDGALVRRATRGRKPAAAAKKRTLSPEGRKRIAEAQRKRWAATKKLAELSARRATPKKVAKKAAKKQPTNKVTPKAEGSSAVPS